MILFATIGLCNVLCTYSMALQDSYNVLLHDKANYKVDLIITEDDYEMIGKDQLKDFKLDPKDKIRLSEFKRIVQAANIRTTTKKPEKKVDLNALKDKVTSTQSPSTSTTTDVVTPMFSDEPFMTVSTDEIMPMYPELTSSSEYTVLPLYSEDANMPMPSEETIMPMSSEETILPMSSEETIIPMSSEEAIIPMSSDEKKLPMSSEETIIPMSSEETIIPMASEDPNIPMSSEEAITPISDEAGIPMSLDDAFTTLYPGDTDSLFSIPPEDLAMPIIVVTGNKNQLFTNYMGLPGKKHAIKKREIKENGTTKKIKIKGITKRIKIKASTKKVKTKEKANEKAKEKPKENTTENATEYDYDSLVEEYYEQEINESRSKDTYQIRRTVLSDYGALNMMKSIFLLRPEKENCTQNDNGIGIQAIRCLLNDYSNQRQVTKDLSARTWRILQIWLFVYLGIAIPVWCTRGWCCCFLRCKFFKPRQTIDEAKKYVVSYPPGVFKKKNGELITYDPSTREKECYEEFEHFIKTL